MRDLPCEVVGVAQPGGQALADERRGQVGGVTEQEDPPGPEAGGQSRPEDIGGAAGNLQAVQVRLPGPWLQKAAERGRGEQGGLVLAVMQLELPAVPVAGDLHEGRRPGRVAHLLYAVPGLQAAGHPDVDYQPALGEAEVLHSEADQVPDRAPGTVAAEHEAAREHAFLSAGPGARRHGDGPGARRAHLVGEPYDIGRPVQGDKRVRGCAA